MVGCGRDEGQFVALSDYWDRCLTKLDSALERADESLEACRRMLIDALPEPLVGDASGDARYACSTRLFNIVLGTRLLVRSLAADVDSEEYWRASKAERLLHAEREHLLFGGVGPVLAWGTTLAWFGNYERGLRSIADSLRLKRKNQGGLFLSARPLGEALCSNGHPRQCDRGVDGPSSGYLWGGGSTSSGPPSGSEERNGGAGETGPTPNVTSPPLTPYTPGSA